MPIDILTAFMDRGVPLAILVNASGDAAVEAEMEPEATSEPGEEEQA